MLNLDQFKVQYIINADGQKSAVILPIEEFFQLLEDLEELAIAAERADEPTISHEQLIEEFAPKIQTIREEFSQNLEFNETVELLETELPREFVYPVEQYPEKIKSHNLDKTPVIRGKLQGIKGQYLILDTGVINIRKYSGYELKIRA